MKFVILTGMSGAGKSTAIKMMEDIGFYCVDNLVDTVEEYNDFCDSVDEEFFKDKRYLRPLTKAPYYAARIRPGGYGTVGGIRVNENCEACDKDFEPIPGLYAAGADACNLYDEYQKSGKCFLIYERSGIKRDEQGIDYNHNQWFFVAVRIK